MQKIVIKNFGPVKDAEIELKKVVILIGEQASGKSTIAKLVYFFRSLKDELYAPILAKQTGEDLKIEFKGLVKQKFINWFGKDVLNTKFEILFFYSLDKVIKVNSKASILNIQVSPDLLDFAFIKNVTRIVEDLRSIENGAIKPNYPITTLLRSGINEKIVITLQQAFQILQNDELFVVAGRSATVTYSELFEKYLFSDIEKKISEKKASADDILTYEFLKKIISIKEQYQVSTDVGANNGRINKSQKMSPLLKGVYLYNAFGERIFLEDGSAIPISKASSGQQEVLRILQDIHVLLENKNTKAFRIVEEPEAHLFPIAQKHLVDLFAQMVNQNEHNQLIITTHSPYILSAFNNLLFAQRVVDKNPDMESKVSEIVDKIYRLKGNDFAAYSLGNTSFTKGEYAYCESIVNPKTQLIAQNYLDQVSEMLGTEFNTLYELHAKKFARA